MDWFFILAVLLLLVGLVTLWTRKAWDHPGSRQEANTLGIVLVGLGVVGILWSATSFPSARTVGVVTEFGRPTGTVTPGFNWVAPWAVVTEFPVSTQVLDLDGVGEAESGGNNLQAAAQMKFDGGGVGYVNLNVNWNVDGTDKAIQLWQKWREFEPVNDRVVKPRVQAVVSRVVGDYLPEDAVKSENYDTIESQMEDQLKSQLDDQGINVSDVQLKRIDVDSTTQGRINKQAAARANVDIAKANQDRARIDNETANLKAQSKSLTWGALYDKCLDIMDAWSVKGNGALPAGWSCGDIRELALAVK